MGKLAAIILLPAEDAVRLENNEQFMHKLESLCGYSIIATDCFGEFIHPNNSQILIAYIPEGETGKVPADFFKKAEVDPRIFVITERSKFLRKTKAPSGMETARIVRKGQFTPELLIAFVTIMSREFAVR